MVKFWLIIHKVIFVNIFGFIVISFLITAAHFFIKLIFILVFLILLTGLLFFIKKYNFNLPKFLKIIILFLILFLILVPILISQKYHEDFGYYHLPMLYLWWKKKLFLVWQILT